MDAGPVPMVARDHADTAMLLRELSSLGFGADDDRPEPPARTRPAPQPAVERLVGPGPEAQAQGPLRPGLTRSPMPSGTMSACEPWCNE